jgi:hypothetical protein
MPSDRASILRAISFNLRESGKAFLVLKNVTAMPESAHIVINYHDGIDHYEMNIDPVPAQQVRVIDIAKLRDSRIPDSYGHYMAQDADFGSVFIYARAGAFVGSDPSFLFPAPSSGTVAVISELDDSDVAPSCLQTNNFTFAGFPPGGGTTAMDAACANAAAGCTQNTANAKCAIWKCQSGYCSNHPCTRDERTKASDAREQSGLAQCPAFPCPKK